MRTAEFFGPTDKSQELQDYSLIVKVTMGAGNSSITFNPSRGLQRSLTATCRLKGVSAPQRCTFHFMCVLDYLNAWTGLKKIDRKYKTLSTLFMTTRKHASVLKPKRYAMRFKAGLEVFFPCKAVAGSIDAYHGKNSKYRKDLTQVVRKIGDMGPKWLRLMKQPSTTSSTTTTLRQLWSSGSGTEGDSGGVTPLMLIGLGVLGVLMVCCIACFLCVAVRKSRRRRRRRKRIRKKGAVFLKRLGRARGGLS